jgi:hypothetical protein
MRNVGAHQRGGASNESETPMTIAEVLHAAIAGGYHIDGSDGVPTEYGGANSEYSVWTRTDNHSSFMIPLHETWLDPAFWRALGRALGWDTPCALAITCGSGQEACRRGDGGEHTDLGATQDFGYNASTLYPSCSRRSVPMQIKVHLVVCDDDGHEETITDVVVLEKACQQGSTIAKLR